MTDLIERLRDDPRPNEWKNGLGPASMEAWHKTCLEAADALEQAQAEIERLNKQFSKHQAEWWDKEDKLQAENERLRTYCDEYAQMTGITLNVSDEMRKKFFKALEDK